MILHEKTAFGALKIIIHMGNAGLLSCKVIGLSRAENCDSGMGMGP